MTNTERAQICEDKVLNPKFNTKLLNVSLQILFQSNRKFQDERLFWFEYRQKQGTYLPQSNGPIFRKARDLSSVKQGTYLPQSKGPIFRKAPKPAVMPSHLLFDG
jgi:hypothetical protein